MKEVTLRNGPKLLNPVRVARLTYVGEPGYEIHAAAEDCQPIYDRIRY